MLAAKVVLYHTSRTLAADVKTDVEHRNELTRLRISWSRRLATSAPTPSMAVSVWLTAVTEASTMAWLAATLAVWGSEATIEAAASACLQAASTLALAWSLTAAASTATSTSWKRM